MPTSQRSWTPPQSDAISSRTLHLSDTTRTKGSSQARSFPTVQLPDRVLVRPGSHPLGMTRRDARSVQGATGILTCETGRRPPMQREPSSSATQG
jgi:hypothetical protein